MKKLYTLMFYTIVCMAIMPSCNRNDNGHLNFSVNEDDHSYSMHADFSKRKTRDVDEYMDSRIGRRSNMSFVNSRIDGTLALDDRTTFYIKKYPGYIEIKLDKDKNSDDAYRQVKSMCAGIKKLLTK